jgi:phosphoserine aminotransferase
MASAHSHAMFKSVTRVNVNRPLQGQFRTIASAPSSKPCPEFSSGPCKKRPGWSTDIFKSAAIGRSHRSKLGKAKLQEAIDKTRTILGVPSDYRIAIVPASDTGAVEMVNWCLVLMFKKT